MVRIRDISVGGVVIQTKKERRLVWAGMFVEIVKRFSGEIIHRMFGRRVALTVVDHWDVIERFHRPLFHRDPMLESVLGFICKPEMIFPDQGGVISLFC